MIILAIESSCDETSCAIVKDGTEVLSNSVSSQIDIHKEYGGVFPEVASRLHVENINIVIKDALDKASVSLGDIDAIAVTQGPGLVGSLHIGVMAAKTLAWSLGIPLIPVQHIAGHIYANKLVGKLEFPLLALVISGGHTELVYMKEDYVFDVIGKTQDDAVGEANDKVGRLLGLPYPGGPVVDKMAQAGKPHYKLPKVKTENPLDFSFSGLKSAVRQTMIREEKEGKEIVVEDMCYAFQHAAVDTLMERVHLALNHYPVKTFVLAGGVAANSEVRKRVQNLKEVHKDLNILQPPLWACMDQAAMIGLAGQVAFDKGYRAGCEMSALSNNPLPTY